MWKLYRYVSPYGMVFSILVKCQRPGRRVREFVEKMRILYYLALFMFGLFPLDMDWHVYDLLKPKCIV